MKSYSLVPLFGALAAAQSMSVWSMSAKPNPSAPTAPGGGAIIEVLVGGPAGSAEVNAFTPTSVTAKKGDVVRFNFMGANNSVAETTFDAPCTPMSKGVSSGFKQATGGTAAPPTFDFTVADSTTPVFMMAEEATSCAVGMVFAVNPAADTGKTTDQTVENLMQKAIGTNKAAAPAMGLVAQGAVAQSAAGQTVTVSVVGAAAATGGAPAAATTVAGQGMTGQGQACGCTCLCGTNSLPQGAGVAAFGGFAGEMPQSPAQVGAMAPAGAAAPSGMVPSSAAMAAPSKRTVAMPAMRRHKA